MSQDATQLLAAVLVARPGGESRRLGDAEADDIRRRQTQVMRDYVGRYRGHIERASGDGLLAVFDSVSAAALAALCLHRRFNAHQSGLATCVAAGEIQVSQVGCAGTPIEQALSVCGEAKPGDCLLTETATALLGSRLTLQIEPGDRVDRAQWRPRVAMSESQGVPPQVQVHDRTPLVGRKSESLQIETIFDNVMAGDPAWISITAEPGMGKTRLVSELATRARDKGMLVLCGVGSEDLAQPFAPLVQALKFWSGQVDDVALRLGPLAGELTRLLPELGERVPDLPRPRPADPETERQQLFRAVCGWLSDLADEEPVLLILDSMHWETESTFQMVEAIARGAMRGRICVLTTQRPDNPFCKRLLAEATRALEPEQVHDMALQGLNEAQVAQFFAAAGQPLAPGQAKSVQAMTGGLPLHVAQMVQRVASGAEAVEQTVQQALAERIADLDSAVRQTVELAAVVGEVFELRDISEVADDPDEALDALDRAVDDGLFHLLDARRMRYRFVHSLTRDAAYQGIRPARLARLHQKVGLALEARSPGRPSVSDLSRHFRKALSLGELERAVRYTRLAADQALAQYANEVALALFGEALDLHDEADDPALLVELMIGQGRAQRRLGQPDFRDVLKQAADVAERHGAGELMARATIAAYRGSYTRALHVDQDAVRRLRQALAFQSDEATVEKARLLSLLAVELTWHEDRDKAVVASRQAVAVARALPESPEATQVLTEVLAHDQWVCFHPTEARLEVAEELQVLAPAHPDPRLRFEIASHDIFTATRIGDRARLDRALAQARELAGQLDQPAEQSMLLLREATVALMEGRCQDVGRLIGQRRELAGRIGEADGEAAFRIHQFWLAYETQPAPVGQQVLGAASGDLPPEQKYLTWPTLLLFACDVGLQPLAGKVSGMLAEEGFDALPRDQMWLWNLCQLAYAAARLNKPEWADELIELLAPQRGRQANMVFNTLGSASRYLGLLLALRGDLQNAEIHLREAITDNREMNAPGWMARSQLDLADLLIRQGQAADQYVEAAGRIAAELKNPLLAARVETLTGVS